MIASRDYSLTGPEGRRAQEQGLAGATWYASPIPRKQMKELMRRTDGPAIRDTLIWFAVLGALGTLLYQTWGTWWAVPVFLVYSIFYGSCGDSRWHECGHGTAFKTPWMNKAIYYLASFLVLRNGTLWRWSHTRHHTDTIVVGRDPEIAVMRPPSFERIFLNLFYLQDGRVQLGRIARFTLGIMNEEEKDFVPESERWKAFLEARIQAAVLVGVVVWCIVIGSVMPAFLIGLPTFFGTWMDVILFGFTQHAGLAEDVVDHRLNCRTVYMNPVFRFIYWNMNYHLEHHMFPMVPYHALPRLHDAMKDDTPPAYDGVIAAWKEILPALWRQRRDPTYFVERQLPPTARPFAELSRAAA
jgi:fatty acid desaturase